MAKRKSRKQEIADSIARELAETRAVQPRLRREFYQRQAARQAVPSNSAGWDKLWEETQVQY